MKDQRVRKTHREVDGETIPIDEVFLVGESLMRFPKDTSLGASAEEIVNCRCVVKYIERRNAADRKINQSAANTTESVTKEASGNKRKFTEATNSVVREYPDANVEDLQIVTIDGVEYRVDGKNVVFDPSIEERNVADLLSKFLKEKVQLVPRVLNPQGVKTPDYMINGEKYDLKTITGTSKNVLYNAVKNKRKQASNFVFDISGTELGIEDLQQQAERLFDSDHTKFVNRVILIKDDNVIKILRRN